MGVLYSVIPFDHEIQNYLKEENLFIPENADTGRNPTVEEIRVVLESLTDYKAEYNEPGAGGTWQAFVESKSDPDREWTLLNMIDYVDNKTPTSIYFEKGWVELIAKILAGLSKTCGTLVLWPDTGDPPLIITPEIELDEALSQWYLDCDDSWDDE